MVSLALSSSSSIAYLALAKVPAATISLGHAMAGHNIVYLLLRLGPP
ncbi:MAG: hypothetical protein HRU05_03320 [Oceanospirillaceae bacterium]|nr:hypothetical protein [Oceanospirillaceae bacterium]